MPPRPWHADMSRKNIDKQTRARKERRTKDRTPSRNMYLSPYPTDLTRSKSHRSPPENETAQLQPKRM